MSVMGTSQEEAIVTNSSIVNRGIHFALISMNYSPYIMPWSALMELREAKLPQS